MNFEGVFQTLKYTGQHTFKMVLVSYDGSSHFACLFLVHDP